MYTLAPSTCRRVASLDSVPARRSWTRRVRCLRTSAHGEEQGGTSEEKLICVDDVLAEVEALNEDYIFTDTDENPVWELEGRIKFSGPEETSNEMPKVKGALDPEALDITSAYSPEQGFMEMTVGDLQSMSHDISLVLDVRSSDEFQSGHVPNAVNVPLPELNRDSVRNSNLEEFKDKRVAVICASGTRSAQATVRLSKVLGFNDVVNIKGGTLKWISEGYPVEK